MMKISKREEAIRKVIFSTMFETLETGRRAMLKRVNGCVDVKVKQTSSGTLFTVEFFDTEIIKCKAMFVKPPCPKK